MATETSRERGHDTVMDVTAEQLATVYAKAFLEASKQADSAATPDAIDELGAVVTEIIERFPDFSEAVRSAFLSHEERVALIDRVLGGRVASVVLRTLKVLSAHNRMELLGSVARQSRELHERDNGRVHVAVTAPQELSADLVSELEAALRAKLGVEPIIEPTVDPDMIAGVKIRVRDTVYDGSLKTIFAKARQSIVERAIERIEHDPKHFLMNEPTGDAANGGAE
ncbi:MAG: ATP synthase F1 subunit delta [Planctomycetota bacterium]